MGLWNTPTAAFVVGRADTRRANDALGCSLRTPVEMDGPRITRGADDSGKGTRKDMSVPDAAPPPSRERSVLVEFPQDELIAKWEEFVQRKLDEHASLP